MTDMLSHAEHLQAIRHRLDAIEARPIASSTFVELVQFDANASPIDADILQMLGVNCDISELPKVKGFDDAELDVRNVLTEERPDGTLVVQRSELDLSHEILESQHIPFRLGRLVTYSAMFGRPLRR